MPRRSGRARAPPTCTTRRTRRSAAWSFPTFPTPATCRSSRTCPRRSCRARSTCRASALIYAGAQKNIGPSGITVVIVREDLAARRPRGHADRVRLPRRGGGRLNAQHAADVRLVFRRARVPVAQARGRRSRRWRAGTRPRQRPCTRRSTPRRFYSNPVAKHCRSWMNVPFRLAKPELDKTFLAEAECRGPREPGGPPRRRRDACEPLQRHADRGRARARRIHARVSSGGTADAIPGPARSTPSPRRASSACRADRYELGDAIGRPDAILVRSADMHALEIPASVLAVGRAGAGTNNIPVSLLTQRGVPVFNAPGRERECRQGAGARRTLPRRAPHRAGARLRAHARPYRRGARRRGRGGQEALRRPRAAGPHARRHRARRDRRRSGERGPPARHARARIRPADHGSARLAAVLRRRAGAEPRRRVHALARGDRPRPADRRDARAGQRQAPRPHAGGRYRAELRARGDRRRAGGRRRACARAGSAPTSAISRRRARAASPASWPCRISARPPARRRRTAR